MTREVNTNEGKKASENLLSNLNLCHNILRTQEGMTIESAFRELNRLLFLKCYCEINGKDESMYQNRIRHLFEEVKYNFDDEHIFHFSETIQSSPASYRDVFGTLKEFSFINTTVETGMAYEYFVQKTLRTINDEPIISRVVADYIRTFLDISIDESVVAPACGYGALLSVLTSKYKHNRPGRMFGYERNQLLAQTCKMNLLMHGDWGGKIESSMQGPSLGYHHFDNVITCIKHRDTVWEDIDDAMNLLAPQGKAALLIPDEILQKEQYAEIRRYLREYHTVMAIISLPPNAVKVRGRQTKWSLLLIKDGCAHGFNKETIFTKLDNIGESSIGLPSEKNDFKLIQPSICQWIRYKEKVKSEYLMWVNLYSLEEWNVEAELLKEKDRYVSRFPLFKLEELVEIADVPLKIPIEDKYIQVTVRQNQHDVIFRNYISTNDIKHKNRQFVVREGQLVVSRINAKDGAIGIVPRSLDGAIVSDNFIVLSIKNSNIDPYYLLMVITSKRYQKVLSEISRGATARSYIKNADLLDLKVPVPDIRQQREMIGKIVSIKEEISKLEKQCIEGVEHFSKELFGL